MMDTYENPLNRPLVVDLDGTVVKSNLLFENISGFLCRYPLRIFHLLGWVSKGKRYLKSRLASLSSIDIATLPFNDNLVSWLRHQKTLGRKLVFATANHHILAESIAVHLDLFDETLATTEHGVNLKAKHKRDALVARYGERAFDYIGNSRADASVWKSAHTSYLVSSSPTLIRKVNKIGNLAKIFSDERPKALHSCLKMLRPHQWVKNFLILIPLLAAHRLDNVSNIIEALMALIVFSLTASSVYVLNDLVDITHDRFHQRKRHRPFAAGNLSLLWGWGLAPGLLLIAFVTASLSFSHAFVAVLSTYFGLSLAYSLRLKQHAILDVLTLSGLYTLRIIAGAVAIHVPLSFWLLTFSSFLFLSLAFIKRLTELKLAYQSGQTECLKGRGYTYHDLELVSSMGIGAGYVTALVLALYIQDAHTAVLYHSAKVIWLACPILLYWISRAWLMAHRGKMPDDPILFAIKDRTSWIVGFCFLSVFVVAKIF